MAKSRHNKGPGSTAATLSPLERRTGARANVAVPVLCRYESVLRAEVAKWAPTK